LAACSAAPQGQPVAADCQPKHQIETLEEGTITVAVPIQPPYSYQVDGKWVGLDYESLEAIAALECLTLNVQSVSYATGLELIQTGRVDTAMGGIYRTDERVKILSMGATVYREAAALVSFDGYANLDSLKGARVGVVQGYLWNEDLQRELGADAVTVYQTSDAMYNDLKAKRIDVAVYGTAEAGYRLQQEPDSGLVVELFEPTEKITATLEPGHVTLPKTLGNDQLTTAFDEDIAELLASGAIAKILEGHNVSGDLAGEG
jgi:polar amino acid transport system substrate-binding protein